MIGIIRIANADMPQRVENAAIGRGQDPARNNQIFFNGVLRTWRDLLTGRRRNGNAAAILFKDDLLEVIPRAVAARTARESLHLRPLVARRRLGSTRVRIDVSAQSNRLGEQPGIVPHAIRAADHRPQRSPDDDGAVTLRKYRVPFASNFLPICE